MFRSDGGFSRFMNTLFDILYVGILWVLFSIPIITAGAAGTAAYYAVAKCIRHKTGYIGREFLRSFKSNFRQMLPLTFIFLAAIIVLVMDILYVWTNVNRMNNALFVVLVLIGFVIGGLVAYVCPVLSRFDKKNVDLLKSAAILLFRYLPVTIGILMVFVLACLGVYLMPWAILVIPGVYLYAFSFPMEYILGKMMPSVEEDSEEAQKWYYN